MAPNAGSSEVKNASIATVAGWTRLTAKIELSFKVSIANRTVSFRATSTQCVPQRIHVLHISTSEEIAYLADHKDVASVGVTPHHLTLDETA